MILSLLKYCFLNKQRYKKTPPLGAGGVFIICIVACLSSCKSDSYETGDGDYSFLHTDFTDLTIKSGTVTSGITDDDVTLIMPSGLTYSDKIKNDTVVRCLLYYSMPDASEAISVRKCTDVSVVLPHDTSEVKEIPTDPVKLTSAWMSKNKRYVNVQLGLMVGSNSDSAARQKLAFVCDSISTVGKGAVFLSLRHDQAGFEQYYTQDVYVSIPVSGVIPVVKGKAVSDVQPDTINVTVNTYSGKQTKQFIK